MISQEIIEREKIDKDKYKLMEVQNKILETNRKKKEDKFYGYSNTNKAFALKCQIYKKRQSLMRKRMKEEFEKRNKIWWNKLENFDINDLKLTEKEKISFGKDIGLSTDEINAFLLENSPEEAKNSTNPTELELDKNIVLNKNSSERTLFKDKSNFLPKIK